MKIYFTMFLILSINLNKHQTTISDHIGMSMPNLFYLTIKSILFDIIYPL